MGVVWRRASCIEIGLEEASGRMSTALLFKQAEKPYDGQRISIPLHTVVAWSWRSHTPRRISLAHCFRSRSAWFALLARPLVTCHLTTASSGSAVQDRHHGVIIATVAPLRVS